MEDTLLEGDEAFDAMITGTDQSAVVSVGASDTATVTITDNDGAYDRDRSYVCVISETHIYVRTLFCIVHKSFFQLGRLRWIQILWVSLALLLNLLILLQSLWDLC